MSHQLEEEDVNLYDKVIWYVLRLIAKEKRCTCMLFFNLSYFPFFFTFFSFFLFLVFSLPFVFFQFLFMGVVDLSLRKSDLLKGIIFPDFYN